MSNSNDSEGSSRMNNIQASATQFWSSMTNLRSSEVEKEEAGVQSTAESVLRVMFGACTTGSRDAGEPDFDSMTPSQFKKHISSSSDGNSPEMLYPKDVSQAVEHLQEKQSSSRRSSSSSMKIPGLFPMSSPSKTTTTTTTKIQSTNGPVFENVIPENATFDDGISAISAHTLEDMALAYSAMDGISRIRSDLTQDPNLKVEESWKQTVVRNGGTLAPHSLSREGRSTNTRHSCQTKSTASTQSEEFVSVFRRNEQDYWNELVKEDDVLRTPQMKPTDFLKLAQDGTITTVPSSTCSGSPTFRNTRSGDDGLLDTLVLPPGTDFAEI
ncbi:unnamed protein product [Cylindrotheca closterium]|uniref:Uncharacterized protein n=1 Tax=Cylindrotheca closterium TaxID=2856 RepID=A0AAD2CPQ3_9STRA|nr:unnamed protein product [Cylindrotheca closterium]